MSDTLLLDRTLWDLCLDASGNIAVASAPYSVAQDVASAARLFLGELWYDTSQGVPQFQTILGHHPPLGILKAAVEAAALTVPTVISARCLVASVSGRAVIGQVQFTTSAGTTGVVSGNLATPTP